MKNILPITCLLLISRLLPAQLNMELAGKREYSVDLNDIWAWVAPDGTEYALVGATTGTSIVSLADPSQPTEVAFVEGPNSIWRDIKTWGHYAYVSNETGGGIHIIDLSGLPGSVRDTFWTVQIGDRSLGSSHNLYIDSLGYCYVAGSKLNRGGVLIADVYTDPWRPSLVGVGADIYAHDVYVRGDLMYTSEIYEGQMAIYDIADRETPLLLGTQNTPFNFTHNIWLSDNGKVAFTTDEQFRAPVAAYDVSDPANISELDQFRPAATLDNGSIPHNVHVWQDWLILSYYFDGGIIIDASRPENLVEVGNFDTFFNLDPGQGAWGAYPFLPSGLVLVTDIGNGLFVLRPNYVRAAWLEGKITDGATGAPINEVRVEILSEQVNVEFSGLNGLYKTGQAIPGAFEVRFFKEGYLPVSRQVTLVNGQLTLLDVEMFQATVQQISGITLQTVGGAIIADAQILLLGEQGDYSAFSNEEGMFQIPEVYQGDYEFHIGKWGYLAEHYGTIRIRKDTAFTITLQKGYEDDFFFDFGWESVVIGDGANGAWVRGEPVGTYRANGSPSNPEFDIAGDFGDQCLVTGNAGGTVETDDVDDGIVVVKSPLFDPTSYADPVLSYYAWFYNPGGNTPADDSLLIQLTNGKDTVILENIGPDLSAGRWREETFFQLRDLIELTDAMQLIVITGDLDPTGHILEAALDLVRIRERELISDVENQNPASLLVRAFPNPFRQELQLDLRSLKDQVAVQLTVFNQTGQLILQAEIPAGTALFSLPAADWAPGLYLLRLRTAAGRWTTVKVVKG